MQEETRQKKGFICYECLNLSKAKFPSEQVTLKRYVRKSDLVKHKLVVHGIDMGCIAEGKYYLVIKRCKKNRIRGYALRIYDRDPKEMVSTEIEPVYSNYFTDVRFNDVKLFGIDFVQSIIANSEQIKKGAV